MLGRRTATAAFAVLVLVVGQLAALVHDAATRHITCAQHGELLEAATLAAHGDDGESRWVGVEVSAGDHEDCAIASALRQHGTAPQRLHVVLAAVAVVAAVPEIRVAARTASVYRLAPKTSPPHLS